MLVFTLGVLAFTCLSGIIWGVSQAQKFSSLSNDNKILRKALFDYQSRYDGIYAVAYPESENNAQKALSSNKPINKAIEHTNLPTSWSTGDQSSDEIRKVGTKNVSSMSGLNKSTGTQADNSSDYEQLGFENTDNKMIKNDDHSKMNGNSVDQSKQSKISNAEHPSQRTDLATAEARAGGSNESDIIAQAPAKSKIGEKGTDSRNLSLNPQDVDYQVSKKIVSSRQSSGNSPEIKNTNLEIEGDSLRVKFDLFSHPPNTLYSGNIWLSAEFETNGHKVILSSPSEVEVAENGTVKNPKQGEKYKVRNFTAKQLSLKIGSDKHKTIKKVTIGISDNDGNYRIINVPLSTVNSETKSVNKRG